MLPQMAEDTLELSEEWSQEIYSWDFPKTGPREELLLFPSVSELQDEDKNQTTSGTNCSLKHTENIRVNII